MRPSIPFVAAALVALSTGAGTWAAGAAPRITSITGYTDDVGVFNGRWAGQPARAPASASNRYKNFLASDSFNYGSVNLNPYYWDINGTDFGSSRGTVTIGPAPSPFTSITIVSWSATKVRIRAVATRSYQSSAIAVTVTTAAGAKSPAFNDNAVGIIKSRGCGQCTWHVAKTRLDQGRSIPNKAYDTTGAIPAVGALDNGYRPAQWDCLVYGLNHVAIIASAPTATPNADGSTTWRFTLTEYNVSWNEALSSSSRTYRVSKPNAAGKRTVLGGIGTSGVSSWVATGYYR